MNENFFEQPLERQQQIINGGLDVFSKYDYKKASTEEIAACAGISKSLLFHYFNSKKDFYLYLYDYSTQYLTKQISSLYNNKETDFFKMIVNAQTCKMQILAIHPKLMLFLVKSYFEDSPVVKPYLNKIYGEIMQNSISHFLKRCDSSKFKEDINLEQVLNIILWMADGFMHSKANLSLDNLNHINDEWLEHVELLRKQFYKKEYL